MRRKQDNQTPVPLTADALLRAIPSRLAALFCHFVGRRSSWRFFGGLVRQGYAAREEGCKAIGVELSEEYTQTAIKRLKQGVLEFTE